MANNPQKSKDPTEVALTAIQDALEVHDGEPRDDAAAQRDDAPARREPVRATGEDDLFVEAAAAAPLSDERLSTLEWLESPIGRRHDHRFVPWWVEDGRDDEFLSSTEYIRCVWMWREIVRRCREFAERPDVVASGRLLTIRYEDFMANPQVEGRRLADHLGVTFGKAAEKVLAEASTSSIGIHRRRAAEEIAEAGRIAGDELRAYGYAV